MTAPGGASARSHIGGPDDFARVFNVSRETIARLEIYVDTLRTWQKRINLVSPTSMDDVWHRHLADSAQLSALAPNTAGRWVDVGSGAGFPGLVVAIIRQETAPFSMTLIESDRRKCAFLQEVARRCSVPVDILCERIEKSATQLTLSPVGVVSARALAPLVQLVDLTAPLFGPGTIGLFPKGRGVEAEVSAAAGRWVFESDLVDSMTDEAARIIVMRRPRRRTEG